MIQWKRVLAEKAIARLADGARRRVGPECLVVGATVVVTRHAEARRHRKNEERRRERQPQRPPTRLRTKETVRRIAEDLRRVKRRKISADRVVLTLKRRPDHIGEGGGDPENDGDRLDPPAVASGGLAKASHW